MNNDRELLQQALDYMDDNCGAYSDDYRKLIEAIRARLAQPELEQMPTKIIRPNLEGVLNAAGFYKQREWQGLTDEEQLEIMKQFGPGQRGLFADAIEAKLKEKNT